MKCIISQAHFRFIFNTTTDNDATMSIAVAMKRKDDSSLRNNSSNYFRS